MTLFHILDATAQDIKIELETEDAREIRPLAYDDSDDDGEVFSRRRGKGRKEGDGVFTQLRMVIHLFGSTPEGKPVRASVEGFEPYFYVALPDKKKSTIAAFNSKLTAAVEHKAPNLRGAWRAELCERKKLFGYTANRMFPFMKLSVDSIAAFRALKKLFLTGDTSQPIFTLGGSGGPLEVFEANLDPMLRFFHLRNVKPCGWVSCEAEADELGHIDTTWEDISPCDAPPMAAAPFLLAAWDIECYSENGEFPLAKKDWNRAAKLVYANATDAEHAIELLRGAALYPDNPPEGMDPLRRADGRSMDAELLEMALGKTELLDALRSQLEPGREERLKLHVSTRQDRCSAIKDTLKKYLGRVLPLAGDPVIQIGVTLVRAGSPTERHIFVLGTCDPVEGAKVYAYDRERDMILGWARFMQERNPDILVGYNVFGFDEKYLWGRLEELQLTDKPAVQSLSRLTDMEKELTLEEKFLSSSALGDNTMWIWTAHGRLQVDLYHYIKRSFSLPAYKLDYVCQHFMSGKLGGVDTNYAPEQWALKTKSTGDVVVGRYVVLLDETGDVAVDKLQIVGVEAGKAVIVAAPVGEDVEDVRAAAGDAVKWAVVKDDVSPQDIFRLQRGSAADRAKVAAYCVQDCDLVVELYKKLDVFNNAMAMANACSVPVGYIFTRGQGIKIESLIFKECHERGQAVAVLPTKPRGPPARGRGGDEESAVEPEESYEGAIVLTPNPGFYFESPVGVADFASLYPSTIISENISHDTLIWAKDYALDGTFLGFNYGSEENEMLGDGVGQAVAWTDIEFDIWGDKEGDTRKHPEKVRKGLRVCRYAQFAGDSKGTLPDIVQKLLAARKAKRKEAEKETDPFKMALLDAEQLAYKLTANSLYGQLGSATFKIRLQHLAASVTAYGRKQIMFAKAAIERFYGPAAGRTDCCAETVYGDTDSLFVNFNVRDPATGERLKGREALVATMHLTEEAGKMVTTCLKPPHDFEYDKVFAPFIIFSKKRYVGNKYEGSPDEYYQNSMGIATKRRDYAGIVKVIYGGAIRILLTEKDAVAAAGFVRDKLMDLAEGRVSMTQLTLTKSLRAEYSTPTPPAHKALADRIKARDPGNAPASGDRISFLYVLPKTGEVASKLQGDRVETPGWIKEKDLKIDFKFYMEHQLMSPISQLFSLTVENLPGCLPPKGKTWATATAADREYAAGEYLFRDALNTCDRAAVRRFGERFFGGAAATKPEQADTVDEEPAAIPTKRSARLAAKVAKETVAALTPATQSKLTSFFGSLSGQKMILAELEKGKKASAPVAEKPKAAKGKAVGAKVIEI